MRKSFIRSSASILVAISLSGCGHHRHEAPPVPVAKIQAPLPPVPDWAQADIGKKLSNFGSSTDCRGAFDNVKAIYSGQVGGTEVRGWAWLKTDKRVAEQILIANEQGQIIGAGVPANDRPDVRAAVPEVTALKVGWTAVTTANSGVLSAYALLADHSLCGVGTLDITPPSTT